MNRLSAVLLASLLASCTLAPESRLPAPRPEAAHAQVAVTAHPLATQAALAMLDKGGTPIDAAIAAQMVLGLVEPQSSGIGGGTLVMHWDAAARKLASYDGLAAAPARATASLRTDTDGKLLPSEPSQRGGRTVGVPGTVAVLAMAHARHGRLAWRELFEPAIEIAEKGFPMPRYMHSILALPDGAKNHAEMRSLYFAADGTLLPVGATVRNPEYAKTMRRIAIGGPAGFLEGGGAKAIVEAAQRGFRPTLMTEQDLRDYRAVEHDPVCAPFLAYRVCTMAPPSFGGLIVLQVLQMVEARAGGRFDFDDPAFAHLYAEAGKLAQADRRRFVGDPAFVKVPVAALAAPSYARSRAAAIDMTRAARDVQPGVPVAQVAALAPDESDPVTATSQIAIADRAGNALSITTTTNLNFGSRLMVDGFMLNNAMTNFSAAPKPGETIANQMAPRKRPGDLDGAHHRLRCRGAARGGGRLRRRRPHRRLHRLEPHRDARQRPHPGRGARARAPEHGGGGQGPGRGRARSATRLAPALSALGHTVEEAPLLSGLGFLKRTDAGWIGAADPRRDGAAMGR